MCTRGLFAQCETTQVTGQSVGMLGRIGIALLTSVLSGVLLAALVFPVVGGLGLVAQAGAVGFLALPSELHTARLATRSTVLAADGSVLATFYRVNRVNTPLAAIPVQMRQAIVAIEDSRFYEHGGLDYRGTLRAAGANARSGRVAQGGSTLTQQYVKNVLIATAPDQAGQQGAVADSFDRKLREARYALALERTLSKDEILARYLNIAYFANGAYGIGTAATYYFHKPVEQLTVAESALLAGVVQNPNRFNPVSRDPVVRADVLARRNTVLGRMRDLGFISEAQRAQVAATPLPVITPTQMDSGCEAARVTAPFFCDYVRHELVDTPVGGVLGATKAERQDKLFGGGLTIRTSLDPKVQAAAQKAVDDQVPNGDPSGVAAVSDIVEPGTGAVRAMAVDQPFGADVSKGQTEVSLPTGGTFGFQPGSTFKAFFLADALQQGIPLNTEIYAPRQYYPTAFSYLDKNGKPQPVSNNGGSEEGTFDLSTAMHASINTFYLQLAERTGLEKPLALAESLGVHQLNRGVEQKLPRVGSAVLGTAGVSPLAMAGAYATFAAHGRFCAPRAVLSITDRDGHALPLPSPFCTQALDPVIADTVTSVLAGVIDGSDPLRTGQRASLGGRPVAGKTGTTNESMAAWFVGYTPQLAAAVWVGNPIPKPLVDVRINGSYYKQVYGESIPAQIFDQTMAAALQGTPVVAFNQPAT